MSYKKQLPDFIEVRTRTILRSDLRKEGNNEVILLREKSNLQKKKLAFRVMELSIRLKCSH